MTQALLIIDVQQGLCEGEHAVWNHAAVIALINTASRPAMALGYPVQLIADAHTSSGHRVLSAEQVIAHHNETLSNIGSFGPRTTLVTSDQVFG